MRGQLRTLCFAVACTCWVGAGTSVYGYDTAGVTVAPTGFNHPNLVSAQWTATVPEYDNGLLRLEFNAIKFAGSSNELVVQWMLMNLCHEFQEDDVVNSTTISQGFSVYLSSQRQDLDEGAVRLADPARAPHYKRLFNNIDGSGTIGVSFFSTQPLREPVPDQPLELMYSVRRGDAVINPVGQFAKDLAGDWTPLLGTYREWIFNISIDGADQDVCKYLLPIEYGNYISSWQPFVLHQEFFGADTDRMGDVQTEARFSGFAVTDAEGTSFPVTDWYTAHRIDGHLPDVWAAKDKRYGWYADGEYLVSRSGHDDDVTLCTREIGESLVVATPGPTPGDANGDGFVDDDDLSLLLANWRLVADWGHGEFSGTPPVNDDDLSLLLANWTGIPAQTATAPEPAVISLLALGGLALIQRRRRQ